ncbi:hypothetical protein [Pseudomonas aeruginosa]|nr:hypothetical protein [Pseudomonas aeruginosa]
MNLMHLAIPDKPRSPQQQRYALIDAGMQLKLKLLHEHQQALSRTA